MHLVVGAVHHYAHVVADVDNTPVELGFIVLVVTIAPWATMYLAWKKTLTIGAALFSLSIAASLLFGLILHFGIDARTFTRTSLQNTERSFFTPPWGSHW